MARICPIFAGAEVRRYLFDNQEVPPASIAALVEENLARRAAGLGLWLSGARPIPYN
jgi:hypothetical protein